MAHASTRKGRALRAAALTLPALALTLGGGLIAASPALATTASTVNPLADYADWNVVSFGDTTIHAESEGPVATAGTLTFTGTNVSFSAATPTALLTGGRVDFAGSSGTLRINSSGAIRIGDLSNADALDVDQNNAMVNTQVVAAGAGYGSTPAIASSHRQTTPVSAPGLFASTFSQAKAVAASGQVAAAATAGCGTGHIVDPAIAYGSANVNLAPGVNFWTLTAAQLSSISAITFGGSVAPSPDNPLIVNVTGSTPVTLSLTMAGARDPHGILFNLPDVTSVTQGGDSIDGSILAPNAQYTKTSANLQGTAIVASAELDGSEEHYFPFTGHIDTCTQGGTVPTEPSTGSDTPSTPTTPTTPTTPSTPTTPTTPTTPAGSTIPASSTTTPAPATTASDTTPFAALVNTGGAVATSSPASAWAIIAGAGALLLAATILLVLRRRLRTRRV